MTARRETAAPIVPVARTMRKTPALLLGSASFWTWFLGTLAVTGTIFAWELRLVDLPLPTLPRIPPTPFELSYTAVLTLLLSLAAGLFGWRRSNGSCPVGVKRSVGLAGALGGLALLCPVCLALPVAFIGLGTVIAVLGQFLPLIRILALLFVGVAIWLLWPKRG